MTVSNPTSETADQTRASLLTTAGVPAATVHDLIERSCRALPHMFRSDRQEFVQTVRRDGSAANGLRPEGDNLRYAAMVALGTAWLEPDRQREILAGLRATDLTATVAARGVTAADLGAGALAAWAAAEVRGEAPAALFDRLVGQIKGSTTQPTVVYAWMLTALVAARELGDFNSAAEQAAERLLAAQGDRACSRTRCPPRPSAGSARMSPASPTRSIRIQALARYSRGHGRSRALGRGQPAAPRAIVDRAGLRRSVVVALRRAHRRRRRGLPGLQRAPARHGADGAVRPARGRRRRPPRRRSRGSALAAHASGDGRRAARRARPA